MHRPSVPTNAHWPPSRFQTSRLTAAGMCREPEAAGARRAGAVAASLSSQIREQQRQRPIEDRRGIAVRDRVSQQILRAAQLVVGLAGDRELTL